MNLIRSIARLLGTILLLVAAFILIGVFAPEVELRTEVGIEKEPVKVYNALVQSGQLESWMTDFHSLSVDDSEELKAGQKFNLELMENEKITRIEGVVMASKSPERLEFFFSRPEAEGNFLVLIDRVGDYSHLTISMKPKGTGMFSRSALFLIQSSLEEDLQNRFQDLKTYLEG